MNALMQAVVARADALAAQWEAAYKRLRAPASIADDLPEITAGITDLLAEPLANGDTEAVGLMLTNAWQAHTKRIATRISYGAEQAEGMPDAYEAAADALGKLVLRRYRGENGEMAVQQ